MTGLLSPFREEGLHGRHLPAAICHAFARRAGSQGLPSSARVAARAAAILMHGGRICGLLEPQAEIVSDEKARVPGTVLVDQPGSGAGHFIDHDSIGDAMPSPIHRSSIYLEQRASHTVGGKSLIARSPPGLSARKIL